MKFTRSLMVSAIFILIAVGMAVWLYPELPARVPSHWNVHGQVDRYMPRFWAAVMPALMILGGAILMVVLPLISPRRFAITPFGRIYVLVMLVVQAFMLVVGVTVLLAGAGYAVPVPLIAMLAVGVLLMVLGNYMGKLRKNFFMGIRTPWTLASDAVWERTHRLGGWTFMLGGVVLIVGALAGGMLWPVIVAVVIAAVIPMVYSFVIYRRLEGRHT
ncbi:MAG TPA: SdpI family protein [Oleiagrimonas sp.]|nr:SdpI family protein [Oleiagrimonas sp.]